MHSAFRFLLDKTEKALRISPEKMADRIPSLMLMDVKEAPVRPLPEKPEILKHMEAFAIGLLVLADVNLAFSQICLATSKAIDILY